MPPSMDTDHLSSSVPPPQHQQDTVEDRMTSSVASAQEEDTIRSYFQAPPISSQSSPITTDASFVNFQASPIISQTASITPQEPSNVVTCGPPKGLPGAPGGNIHNLRARKGSPFQPPVTSTSSPSSTPCSTPSSTSSAGYMRRSSAVIKEMDPCTVDPNFPPHAISATDRDIDHSPANAIATNKDVDIPSANSNTISTSMQPANALLRSTTDVGASSASEGVVTLAVVPKSDGRPPPVNAIPLVVPSMQGNNDDEREDVMGEEGNLPSASPLAASSQKCQQMPEQESSTSSTQLQQTTATSDHDQLSSFSAIDNLPTTHASVTGNQQVLMSTNTTTVPPPPPQAHHLNTPRNQPKTPKIRTLATATPTTPQTPTVLDLSVQQQQQQFHSQQQLHSQQQQQQHHSHQQQHRQQQQHQYHHNTSSRMNQEDEDDCDSSGVPRFSRMVPGK